MSDGVQRLVGDCHVSQRRFKLLAAVGRAPQWHLVCRTMVLNRSANREIVGGNSWGQLWHHAQTECHWACTQRPGIHIAAGGHTEEP